MYAFLTRILNRIEAARLAEARRHIALYHPQLAAEIQGPDFIRSIPAPANEPGHPPGPRLVQRTAA